MHLLNSDFNFHTWLNRNRCNLTNNLGRTVQVNQSLVNVHLIGVPSFTTFSVGSFTGSNSKVLGRHTDWALDLKFLVLGSLDEVGTNLFQSLDVTGSESDADAVNDGFDYFLLIFLLSDLHLKCRGDLKKIFF